MAKNLISVQFMHVFDANEMVSVIEKLNPKIVKFCFTPPNLILEVMNRCPEVEGVFRLWWEYDGYIGKANNFEQLRAYIGSRGKGQLLTEEENNRDTLGSWFNPRDAVLEWGERAGVIANNLGQVFNFPTSVKNRLLVEGHNESGGQGFKDFCRFEKERCLWLAEKGLRAVVFNSGVGWNIDWSVAEETGLLEVMQRGNHYLGTHGYGNVLINMFHSDMQAVNTQNLLAQPFAYYRQHRRVEPKTMTNSWLAFRCVRYDQELRSRGYNIKQVLTEFGLDRSAPQVVVNYSTDGNIGAWKGTIPFWNANGITGHPDQIYAEELMYGEEQLRVYQDFVVGATTFTYGAAPDSAWTAFDIRGTSVVPRLTQLLQAKPNGGSTPTDPNPQPAGCTVELAEKQPDGSTLTAVNIRSKPYIIQNSQNQPLNRIAVMRRGDTWKALGLATTSEGTQWIKLQTAEGQVGWGVASLLKVTCGLTPLPVVEAPPKDDTSEDCSEEVAFWQQKFEQAEADKLDLQTAYNALDLELEIALDKLTQISEIIGGDEGNVG